MASPANNAAVPLTVLTGYLGAGQTTLLNRILTHEHGQKVAVIVNEFGEVGIDNQLVIETDEEIFEMNNGYICCTVRGDLIRILGNLMKRRHQFEHVVIETTGLAAPAPIIQAFFTDEDMRERFALDAVVTVVDAKHIYHHWKAGEVVEQLAFADIVLLNKTDLLEEAELLALEQKIHAMNALAKVYRTCNSAVEMEFILGVQAFDLNRAVEVESSLLKEAQVPKHDDSVGSVAVVEAGAIDGEKLNRWLGHLLQTQGADIFRMKGLLNITGEDQRFVFQGVHRSPGRASYVLYQPSSDRLEFKEVWYGESKGFG